MKKTTIARIALAVALIGTTISPAVAEGLEPHGIRLQPSSWSFKTTGVPQSQLNAQRSRSDFQAPANTEKGFTIRFTADLANLGREACLLEIPWVLSVNLRQGDPQERNRQNYPAFKRQDGTVPVLEASLALQSSTDKTIRQDMTVGFPLAMLGNPLGKHEITLNFSGVNWSIYVDGKLMDNDFPLGYPNWKESNSWNINPAYVKDASLYLPAIPVERIQASVPEQTPEIQYWTPGWHNAWVGDVVTFFHKGRYHLFYLFDRRGHGSKFGRGGHYFEHLSTADFRTWTEHEPATPIEHQWETFGTGTPFVYDNQFCISYGLHSTRIYPKEQTSLPIQWDYLEKNGSSGSFLYDTMTCVPAGSTYSISEDGITNFKKTHLLFHPCENPSIYTDPDGKLKMLANYGAKGTWESKTVNQGWHCTNPDFPLGGDCTFFFRWGNFDYIIGGFTRQWAKPANAPETAYQDIVSLGQDFYNGLSVPAVTEIPGGRFLMAGWLQSRAWGGPLVIHELIQYPDGRIGTKWMDEIIPATGKVNKLARKLAETEKFSTESPSFLVTFDVVPSKSSKGKVDVVFLSEDGEQNACELQICPDGKTAQYANGSTSQSAGKEKSLRQGGNPQQARNYAIENLVDTDKPFTVRLIVKGTGKFGGSVIDTEIAGQRTMVTYRPELIVKQLLFRSEDVLIKNVRLAPLQHP